MVFYHYLLQLASFLFICLEKRRQEVFSSLPGGVIMSAKIRNAPVAAGGERVAQMAEIFLFSLRVVMPILLLMALGWLTARWGRWERSFFESLNALCFRLFLPVQLFMNVYEMESFRDVNWRVLLYLVGGILFALGLGVVAARFCVSDPRQRGVIAMASFRSNQVVLGLPMAEALGGQAAMGFASVASSFCVPVFNALAVLTLSAYSEQDGKKPSVAAVLKKTLRNPLILGALTGFAALGVRKLLPTVDGAVIFSFREDLPSLYKAMKDVAKVASPLMIFALGAKLDLKAAGRLKKLLALGTVLRLLVSPAILIGTALLLRDTLQLTAAEIPALVAVFASPAAVSGPVMVQEIGGDEQLASQVVMWTTVFSMLSVFTFAFVLRSCALL